MARTRRSLLKTVMGSGQQQDSPAAHIPTPDPAVSVVIGTNSMPDTGINPAFKVSRTMALPASSVYGDGSDSTAAILGVNIGTTAQQTQIIGILGTAANSGTVGGTNQAGKTITPDVVGVYATAEVDGGGGGAAIGIFTAATGYSATTKNINPIQIYMNNSTGIPSPVIANAQALCRGITMYNSGASLSGVGIELIGPTQQVGPQSMFDVGYHTLGTALTVSGTAGVVTGTNTLTDTTTPAAFHTWDINRPITVGSVSTHILAVISATQVTTVDAIVNGSGVSWSYTARVGSVATAAIQDDAYGIYSYVDNGWHNTSILINGTNTTAAIAINAGAGPLIIGATSPVGAATLLEVRGPNSSTANPLVIIGNGGFAQPYSVQLRNSQGTHYWALASSTGGLVTGSVIGDAALYTHSTGTHIHLAGSISVIKVGADNTLGFFNVTTGVVQPTASGTLVTGVVTNTGSALLAGTTFSGGLGTSRYTISDVVLALKNLGLIAK